MRHFVSINHVPIIIKKETKMVENLRTGDVVTIDKWMNEYEFTPE